METANEVAVFPDKSPEQRVEEQIAAVESNIKRIRAKLKGLESGDTYVIHSLGLTRYDQPSPFFPLDEAALIEALNTSNRILEGFKKRRSEMFVQ